MFSRIHIKILLLSIFPLCASILNATTVVDKYGVQSGIVIYKISGNTQLTNETNLTIDGETHLRFKAWGDMMLIEENGILYTTGAIKHKQEIQKQVKYLHDKVITVDFEHEQLLERKKLKILPNKDNETIGFKQQGEEVIGGYPCEIWVAPGIKKCLYKGVVLKQELHIYGVEYIKEATEVVFDINTSNDKCTVPDFPVQEFGLYKDKIKTKNSTKSEKFCAIIKEVSSDIKDNFVQTNKMKIDDKKRQKFINHIGRDIFKKQKVLLPKWLDTLKESRVCLQTANNPSEANICLEHFSEMKNKLGTNEDNYVILWDDKYRDALLDKIEDELIHIQSRIPCVNRAKNITDLSACMK